MKKTLSLLGLTMVALVLSGCDGTTSTALPKYASGGVIRSSDGGQTWEKKVTVNEKQNISGLNILQLITDPKDGARLFAGTEKNGIFASSDAGENWEKLPLTTIKNYSIVVSPFDRNVIYTTGVLGKVGKIFKSEDSGKTWVEIYTEPTAGTVVISLEMNPSDANVLYAGTSKGLIIKTTDGGKTWRQLKLAGTAVFKIDFDAKDRNVIYFGLFQRGIMKTTDGGETFVDLKISTPKNGSFGSVLSMKIDPVLSGGLYVSSMAGLVKTTDFGENWSALLLLTAPQQLPIRALAINPKNNSEIIMSAGSVIYKSIDGGVNWSTTNLVSDRNLQALIYNQDDPTMIYGGLRKVK